MKSALPYWIVGSTALVSVSMILATFMFYGINEHAVRLTLRETARLSFAIFLVVFITSSFHKLYRNSLSKWLLTNRRYLGIAFGVSHLIHLGLILLLMFGYSSASPLDIADTGSLIVGGIGYFLVFIMLLTSNNPAVKRLGYKRWKRIHTLGMYYLFITFLISFVGLLEKNILIYGSFVLLMVMALVFRCSSFISFNKKVVSA